MEGTEGCQQPCSCPAVGSLGPCQESPSTGGPRPRCHGPPEPRGPPLTAGCGEGAEAGRAAAAGVPDADGAISRAGGQALGGGAEGQAPHRVPVALQDVAQHARVWASQREERAASGPRPHSSPDSPGAPALPSHPPVLVPSELLRL